MNKGVTDRVAGGYELRFHIRGTMVGPVEPEQGSKDDEGPEDDPGERERQAQEKRGRTAEQGVDRPGQSQEGQYRQGDDETPTPVTYRSRIAQVEAAGETVKHEGWPK